MKFEIKRRNGLVLYTAEAETIREAVEQACRSGADLSGAKNADLAIIRAEAKAHV